VFPCVEDGDCTAGYVCDAAFATCTNQPPPAPFDPGVLLPIDRPEGEDDADAQQPGEPDPADDGDTVPTLVFEQTWTRTSGAPGWSLSFFDVEQDDARALAVFSNDGCSSAHVTLNGSDVLRPSDLNRNVTQVERELVLEESNRVRVRLASSPGCQITLDVIALLAP
jgi:hypothetical protein